MSLGRTYAWIIVSILVFHVTSAKASISKASYLEASATYNPAEGERWIDFMGSEDHQIILPVRVDGVSLLALVDTGAPATILSASWARQHGLVLEEKTNATGSNGMEFRAWKSSILSKDFGAFHQKGGDIWVTDSDIFHKMGSRIDMIIGMDFIDRMVTEIDFDHSRIRMRIGNIPSPNGRVIPINYSANRGRMSVHLKLYDRDISPVIIDTGDNGSMTLLKSIFPKYPERWKVTNVESSGLGGTYVSDYARLDGIEVGDYKFNGIPVSFEEKPALPGEKGSIGLELLSRYNLFIDGPKGILILSDRKILPPAPLVTNMGIQGPMTEEGWSVTHIMRNSPAAAVGLKQGDRICVVNGERLGSGSAIPRGPDGSTMHIVLCDGRKIDLVRQTFY